MEPMEPIPTGTAPDGRRSIQVRLLAAVHVIDHAETDDWSKPCQVPVCSSRAAILAPMLPLPVGDLLLALGHDALSIADSHSSVSFFDVMVPVIVCRLTVLE